MESAIRPELAHDRFVEMDACEDCGYADTSYTAAKAVIADYFGVVDGAPHTVTVSDLSDAGVTTAIRYGNEAGSCTLTSAPNYTEAGDYPVYYEVTYTLRTQIWWRTAWPLSTSGMKRSPGTAPAPAAAAIQIAAAKTRTVTAVAVRTRAAGTITTGCCWTASTPPA